MSWLRTVGSLLVKCTESVHNKGGEAFVDRDSEMIQLQPRIGVIKLKSGEQVRLEGGSILAIVGPNNSGKSHFLKQLRACLYGASIETVDRDAGLIESLGIRWPTADRKTYLQSVAAQKFERRGAVFDAELPSRVYGSAASVFTETDIQAIASDGNCFGPFVETFVRFDEPLSRISESERQLMQDQSSPLIRLRAQKKAYEAVQKDFAFVFDEDIYFHQHEGKLNFFLGKPPTPMPLITEAYSPEIERFLEGARTIDRQGLGMRNVVGLLLRLYTDARSIILLDEPEAFLHPPQANRLGQVIQSVCERRKLQVICASHDRNLISGLSKAKENQLVVQRLSSTTGSGVSYFSRTVSSKAFDNVRALSRIRFTPVLESMFASVAVLVENENDALFFESALEFYAKDLDNRSARTLRDSLLFIPTNGNSNFASTAQLLRNLCSPTVIVGDLDICSDPKRLRQTVDAMNPSLGEEAEQLAKRIIGRFSQIHEAKLAKIEKGKQEGKLKKWVSEEVRVDHEDQTVRGLVGELLLFLKGAGIVLIPEGELEDFGREVTSSSDKNIWVREAIDQQIYAEDNVQGFCETIVSAAFAAIDAQARHTSSN